MNVLWIAPYPVNPNAHAAAWITSLAKAMTSETDINLTVLTISAYQSEKEIAITRDGISIKSLKDASDRGNFLLLFAPRILRIRRWLKQNEKRFDLIHIHGTEYLFHIAAKGLQTPSVVSIQGLLYLYHKALPDDFSKRKLTWMVNGALESIGIKQSRNFICRTSWDTTAIRMLNPTAKIYSAWEMIREEFYTEHNYNFSSATNILFMGGTSHFKGIAEALEVVSRLQNAHQITMTVIGGGTEQELCEIAKRRHLTNLKVGQNFFHLGNKNALEICELMSKSFCLLHPSYIDNSPNSVCEAQVFGLPVVASNVGGVSSLIENEETGLLTKLEVEDIYTNVHTLLINRELSKKITRLAQEKARERHAKDTVIASYKDIYKHLLTSDI